MPRRCTWSVFVDDYNSTVADAKRVEMLMEKRNWVPSTDNWEAELQNKNDFVAYVQRPLQHIHRGINDRKTTDDDKYMYDMLNSIKKRLAGMRKQFELWG